MVLRPLTYWQVPSKPVPWEQAVRAVNVTSAAPIWIIEMLELHYTPFIFRWLTLQSGNLP